MQNSPSYEGLDASYQVLRSIVMHPEFQSVVAEILTLHPSERLHAVLTQLTPEALKARGIAIPGEYTFSAHVLQDKTSNTGSAGGEVLEFCINIPLDGRLCTSMVRE